MNLNLTNKCNNHCAYCFQEDWKTKPKEELSLDDIKKILTWASTNIEDEDTIVLMGGEPTLYSQFTDLINYINTDYPDSIVLIITNALGPEEAMRACLYHQKTIFLVNSTYDQDKETLFFKNLDILYKRPQSIAFSITLVDDFETNKYYIDRLVKISHQYPEISKVRIGLYTPKPSDNLTQIHNYYNDLIYLFETLLNNSYLCEFGFDCSVNFCQLTPEQYIYITERYPIGRLDSSCQGPCVDILPDLSSKYCSSGVEKQFTVDNIFKFNSYQDLVDYYMNLNSQYTIENKMCNNCKYLYNICFPCHSFDMALKKSN